jgi:hypothetical protein
VRSAHEKSGARPPHSKECAQAAICFDVMMRTKAGNLVRFCESRPAFAASKSQFTRAEAVECGSVTRFQHW